MDFRLYTGLFSIFAAATLFAAASVHAETVSTSAQPGRGSVSDTQARAFGVAPEKGYFEYRLDIPLVEQFMKKWDAQRRS